MSRNHIVYPLSAAQLALVCKCASFKSVDALDRDLSTLLAQADVPADTRTGTPADAPLSTIAAGGEHHAIVQTTLAQADEARALRVAAFLVTYYGAGQPVDLRDPMDTITTRDRLALVTVVLRGVPHVIVDIGLRMLSPRELYRAQGFPADYIIDRTAGGKPLTKSAQVRMCGNSVSPKPMQAIVAANYGTAKV